jgi:uncharacterized protein YjbI with pentapeptide repeats
LGDDKAEVRLGGIYALERIAKDSERDRTTIAAVLSAFVRERSPKATDPTCGSSAGPAADIDATLFVLGRLNTMIPKVDRPQFGDISVVDIPNTCLVKASLTGVDFSDANLGGSNLSNAILVTTNLNGANLASAALTNAVAIGAKMSNAYMSEAILTDAHLGSADMRGAIMRKARLNGAKLDKADLAKADLEGVIW